MGGMQDPYMSRRYGAGVLAAEGLEFDVQAFVPVVAGQSLLVR